LTERAASSVASRDTAIVPNAATARAPPIDRKNWFVAVATPRSLHATAFWTATTSVWIVSPMPTPTTTVARTTWRSVLDGCRREMSRTDRKTSGGPTTG